MSEISNTKTSDFEGEKKNQHSDLFKTILGSFLSFIVWCCIFYGLQVSNVFSTVITVGTSMQPNYHTNDFAMVSNCLDIDRYDVVTAVSPKGTAVIKRVIGLPGDTITFKNKHIYINGELSDESFIRKDAEVELFMSGELELGEDEYFIAGDNRNNSSDSRLYGAIKRNDIEAVVLFKVPFSFEL